MKTCYLPVPFSVFFLFITNAGLGETPATAPASQPAVAAIWLRGKLTVKFDDEPAGAKAPADFEILLDGGGCYFSREWSGKRGGISDEGYEDVNLVLPYWEGKHGESWGEMGGRGGGSSGYHNMRGFMLPGSRLWHSGKAPGAKDEMPVVERPEPAGLREEFVGLKDHQGILIPQQIIWRDKYMIPKRTFYYEITQVELLDAPQTDVIMALRKKYFGDTRQKDTAYPGGAKHEEHIYNGDLPVEDREWFADGKLESSRKYTNGLTTSRTEWYPDGKKKIEEHMGHPYSWTEWGEDGAVLTEGEQVYEDDSMTGWMKTYYPGGQKKEVRHEVKSLLDGVFQSWDEKGNIIDDGVYRDGRPWSGRFYWIHSGEHGSNGASDHKAHYYKDGREISAPQGAP